MTFPLESVMVDRRQLEITFVFWLKDKSVHSLKMDLETPQKKHATDVIPPPLLDLIFTFTNKMKTIYI